MKSISGFFPGFNRSGLGRKPIAGASRLTRKIHQLDALCLAQLQVLCGHLLPSRLTCFKTTCGANSRKRVFTPALTFWAWLSQVFDPASSCRSALCRVQALCAARCLGTISHDTAAYCRARLRLPARLLLAMSRHLSEAVVHAAGDFGSGGRLLVMDGTTLTMPDSPANSRIYSYAPGQQPGCGFPLMFLLGLFDLNSGACLRVVKSPARRHE